MGSIDEATIEQLTRTARLPLSAQERRLLAPMYRGLIDAANELSRKMSEPRFQAIGPSFTFAHAPLEESEE